MSTSLSPEVVPEIYANPISQVWSLIRQSLVRIRQFQSDSRRIRLQRRWRWCL